MMTPDEQVAVGGKRYRIGYLPIARLIPGNTSGEEAWFAVERDLTGQECLVAVHMSREGLLRMLVEQEDDR